MKAIRDTGKTVNEDPEVEFDLEVNLGGYTHETTHSQIVPRIALANFQPGATVPVKVDPEDDNNLVIA